MHIVVLADTRQFISTSLNIGKVDLHSNTNQRGTDIRNTVENIYALSWVNNDLNCELDAIAFN